MEVSTIKMAGSNGHPLHRSQQQHQHHQHHSQQQQQQQQHQQHHYKSQLVNTSSHDSPTGTPAIRHSPEHHTASIRSHHSSPSSSSDQSVNGNSTGHHSPHSTSPLNHAVVSSSTFKQEGGDGGVGGQLQSQSVIMKQEQHTELPPIHQAAFGAYYGQAVPYVTSLADTQTVLLQTVNGEYYRAPLTTSVSSPVMMDYGAYGFQTRQFHQQDPSGGGSGGAEHMLVERYRQANAGFAHSMSSHISGINVDLPSPDSGLGGDGIAARDHTAAQVQLSGQTGGLTVRQTNEQ